MWCQLNSKKHTVYCQHYISLTHISLEHYLSLMERSLAWQIFLLETSHRHTVHGWGRGKGALPPHAGDMFAFPAKGVLFLDTHGGMSNIWTEKAGEWVIEMVNVKGHCSSKIIKSCRKMKIENSNYKVYYTIQRVKCLCTVKAFCCQWWPPAPNSISLDSGHTATCGS